MTDSFDLNSGGGNPSFSFGPQGSQPGASVTGTVVDLAEVQQRNFDTKEPETWDNGDPKMQIRLTLQTELRDPNIPNDTGIRDVYLRGRKRPHDNGAKSTICAALDAVRAATGDTKMARGARFAIQWVSGMGFSGDPRNYQASYAPPALDLGGQQSAAQAPAQVQAQQAPPAWAQPVQQQPVQPAPVPQHPAAASQFVQTPQGVVDTTTGQLVQPAAPVQQPSATQPATQPAAVPGYTPEQIAAMEAAGVNPAAVAAAAQQPTQTAQPVHG
jgi:hypothetical protein